jgi:hypothetical protein
MKHGNRMLKESIEYFETMNAKIGSLVLHGIGPACWENPDDAIPIPLGVEDVLIPGRTTLGFKNLPFFILRRTFTSNELKQMTRGPHVNPGWNQNLVKRCLEWLDKSMTTMVGGDDNFTDSWSPEKWEERIKEDSAFCAGDDAPAIRCFDIYGYQEATSKEASGWVRRIILDSWSTPTLQGGKPVATRRNDMEDRSGSKIGKPSKEDFLFTSGGKPVGASWQNIISFQFADLSAVTPKRYHSVRGLGWLLYAPCHLRNRMLCKFYEAVFEALLQYFKVKNADDFQKTMKLELAQLGILDETMMPIPANERWQPNVGLAELGLQQIQQTIDQNAKSWTGQPGQQQQGKQRETNFQRMADLQAINALVSAALNQAYQYQVFEYREIVRRMMRPNSKDPLVRKFRDGCLRDGLPEKLLNNFEAWDIQSERMMGGGNQTLEMLIAQQLMEYRPMLDPEPQRVVLRDAVMALTKNPQKALELVPESPAKVTPAVVNAEQSASAMLNGIQVKLQTGINHLEYVGEMLQIIGSFIQKAEQGGNMMDQKTLVGVAAMVQNCKQHIAIIAQDETQKAVVKQMGDILGQFEDKLKGFAQRLQQAMQKQAQNGNGKPGMDPKDAAKIQATAAQAKSKMDLAKESHAQKSAQRQIQFEQKLKQDAVQHAADLAGKDLEVASNINRNRMQSMGDDDEKE